MPDDPKKQFAGGDVPKFFSIDKFMGINTQAKREGIKDQQFSWLENMQPIGDNNLQAMFDTGPVLYANSNSQTVIYFYPFNVGSTNYIAVFFSDGTAISFNLSTSATTTITNSTGTFYPGSSSLGSPMPACAQYANSGIVIVTTASVNGYYSWDGSTLVSPGGASPSWLNGGTPTTMPTGVAGTAVTTYQGRVWIANGNKIIYSAPGNGADFSGADGGGTFASTDPFLKWQFNQIAQSNGFLYTFADSSVNVISNVQTSGSPVLTTFNNQNVDPQVGTPWHNSVQPFGRGLVFANAAGVYVLYGGAAEKVSDDLDGIFAAANATLSTAGSTSAPSSAFAIINNIRVYMLLVPVQGPFDTSPRNAMVMWDGKKWWIASQDASLTFINTQEINSQITAYGTDGTNIFAMFQSASANITKIWQTKMWPGDGFQITKQAMRVYTFAVDNSGDGYAVSGTLDTIDELLGFNQLAFQATSASFFVTWENNSPAPIQWQNNTAGDVDWTAAGQNLEGTGLGINSRGNYMGMTEQSTSLNFTLITQSLLYQEQSPLGA
jgi:hypothetical protein